MQKLILYLATFLFVIFLQACNRKQQYIKGYIVGKEYVAGHMCHKDAKRVYESGFVPIARPVPHHHTWQQPTWTIWIANRNQTINFNLDSLTYLKYKVGGKYTIYY